MKPVLLTLLSLLMISCLPAWADETVPPFKFTAGYYDYGSTHGTDGNLRWQNEDTHAWVGYYTDPSFGSQWRTGADTSLSLADWASLQPSLQLATQGFAGGSVNLQLGGTWYGVVGLGRTNLHPYFNLNFDPNDAITLGAGWHPDGGPTISMTLIADDRTHTGQKHLHLYGRWPLADGRRLTLDILRKQGIGDEGYLRAWGWSVGYDWPRYFVRITRDDKQNFSAIDATRLQVGTRF